MIKVFPSTIQFDDDKPASVLFAPPESSSSTSSSTPSCYTPSSESTAPFDSESTAPFDWLPEGLSASNILAPTVPDLAFSFVPPTNWKSSNTPVSKSNNTHHTPTTPKNNSNSNVASKTHYTHSRQSFNQPTYSTPTQDPKPKVSCSSDGDIDDKEHEDEEEEGEKELQDSEKESRACFSRTPTAPFSNVEEKLVQAGKATPKAQQTHCRMKSAPMSLMGSGATTMMATPTNEKAKAKKSLSSMFGTSGRFRGSISLESQLEDVLSQAEHLQQQSMSAAGDYQCHSRRHTAAAGFKMAHADSSPGRPTGQYQKAKKRFSSFLSLIPADSVGPASSPQRDEPVLLQSSVSTKNKPSYRRSSGNLLDKASHSFSQASFRTFNSSNTDHLPNGPLSTHPSTPEKQATINNTNNSPLYLKSSRSFLNLLSSKLK